MKKELKFKKQEDEFIKKLRELDIINDSAAVLKFVGEHYGEYLTMLPDKEYKIRLLMKVYKEHMRSDAGRGTYLISITDKEIAFLQSLPNELIKRLFYSLIIRMKVRPHPSGWISLDFENTIFYGLKEKEARKAKIEIYSECTPYGFETRVSGSTKPVLCFKIPEIEAGSIVFEFVDGEAIDRFEEIIKYDNNSNKS